MKNVDFANSIDPDEGVHTLREGGGGQGGVYTVCLLSL